MVAVKVFERTILTPLCSLFLFFCCFFLRDAGHPPSAASPVTNLVTTGPDGVAGLDEASQQSTLSNTSAASGDDVSAPSTPRSRKETGSMPMTPSAHHPPFSQPPQQQQQHGQLLSHPPTPQSSVPSPGPASLPSQHEDYNDVHSPGPGVGNWTSVSTRPTPSSPVIATRFSLFLSNSSSTEEQTFKN